MKKYLLIFLYLNSLACSEKNIGGEEVSPSINTSIEGSWDTGCFSYQSYPVRASVTFSNGSYSTDLKIYSDSGCINLISKTSTTGSYSIGSPTPSATSEAKELNWIVGNYKITLGSNAAVTSFNSNSYCGFSDWQINVPKDVTGLTCSGDTYPATNDVSYDIYKVALYDDVFSNQYEAGDLLFGYFDTAHDGTSPDTRPVTISANVVFKKQ